MGKIKWIKLMVDVFDDKKFDAIKTLPDSNDIQLIWIKLLCLAGTCDSNGFLMLTREIPYTNQMLAKKFDMEIGVVQRALNIFCELRMIEVVDSIYMVSNWLKYQNNDRLEQFRENNRLRQKQYRERQKLLVAQEGKTEGQDRNVTDNVTDNVKNNGKCSISISDSISESNIGIIKNVVNYLNTVCNTNYKYSSEATKKKIRARLNEGFTEDDFYSVIDVKYAEWGKDSSMSKYLRPETLFGTKFESYLNQCPRKEDHIDNSKTNGGIKWQ